MRVGDFDFYVTLIHSDIDQSQLRKRIQTTVTKHFKLDVWYVTTYTFWSDGYSYNKKFI